MQALRIPCTAPGYRREHPLQGKDVHCQRASATVAARELGTVWGQQGNITHCLPFAKGAKVGMGNGGIAAPAPPLPAVEASS